MSNPFTPPAPPGEGIKWEPLKGALLLVEPLSVETGIQTAFGIADAVKANVYVLDGSQAGEEYPGTLVFPKLLQSQLSSQIGAKVLGRLTTGTAKPNQSPPWILEAATEQDQQVGVNFLNQRSQGQVAQPAGAGQGADVPF